MATIKQEKLSKLGVFTLLFAACFTIMVGSVINPALPAIAQQLGFPHSSSWLVTFPSLGVVLFGALAGRFIDRAGAYRAMILGLALYGLIGVAAIFFTFSAAAVLADRFLLGGATAIVMAGGTTLIAEFFEGEERLRMIAVQGMTIELGGVLFLSLGGILGAQGWRLPFLLYLMAWLCLGLFVISIPKPKEAKAIHAQVAPPSSEVRWILLAAVLAMTLFFVAFITLPASLALRFHLDESRTGYFLAFISVMAVASAACLSKISRLMKMKTLLAMAFFLFGVAHITLALSTHLSGMIFGAVLMGCGFGFSIPVVNHMMVEESAIQERGRNLGYLSVSIFLGQFLSSFVNLISPDGAHIMACTGVVGLVVSGGWFFVHGLRRPGNTAS